jgi:hypothetical protein
MTRHTISVAGDYCARRSAPGQRGARLRGP